MVEPHAKPFALHDEELDELPPLDGDSDDDESDTDSASADDLDNAGDAGKEGKTDLDDATGEGDPLDEMEFGGSESGWLEDAADADGLDVGGAEIDDEDNESSDLLEGAEGPGVEDDDFALGTDEPQQAMDAGEEGFDGEDEELREEDLPRLDSGEDAEVDDADLGEGWLPSHDQDETEEARPGWDERTWSPAGAPVQLAAGAVDAVVCAGRGVIAASVALTDTPSSVTLSRVDLEGAAEALEAAGLRGGAVTSLCSEKTTLLVSTSRAGVLVSRDGGATFVDANGWRDVAPRGDADAGLEIALSRGEVWGRTSGGALVRSGDSGHVWGAVAVDGRIVAIAVDAGSGTRPGGLVALARRGERGDVLALGRDVDGEIVWTILPALPQLPFSPTRSAESVALVVRGTHVAVRVGGHGVLRATAAGWSRIEGSGAATAATFSDEDGTLLVALYSTTEERAWLAHAQGESLRLRLVAEVGEATVGDRDEPEARVRCLVWDDAHGVAWAAGGFGLVALHPGV
jgi:hypothetical protein